MSLVPFRATVFPNPLAQCAGNSLGVLPLETQRALLPPRNLLQNEDLAVPGEEQARTASVC